MLYWFLRRIGEGWLDGYTQNNPDVYSSFRHVNFISAVYHHSTMSPFTTLVKWAEVCKTIDPLATDTDGQLHIWHYAGRIGCTANWPQHWLRFLFSMLTTLLAYSKSNVNIWKHVPFLSVQLTRLCKRHTECIFSLLSPVIKICATFLNIIM